MVVERRVRAEFLGDPANLVLGAGAADHPGPAQPTDLYRERADTTGGRRYEQGLAGLEVGDDGQPDPGGQAGVAQRGESVLTRQVVHHVEAPATMLKTLSAMPAVNWSSKPSPAPTWPAKVLRAKNGIIRQAQKPPAKRVRRQAPWVNRSLNRALSVRPCGCGWTAAAPDASPTPSLLEACGTEAVVLGLAAVLFLGFLLTWVWAPETRGLSLHEASGQAVGRQAARTASASGRP
ncbi:hypothetical protein [Actinomycetospora atypica]|uniref:Uncharacterized protein n=1 Tax=Actinomycetospora atypica TaxID=1290095 RepID=A0ABV9YRR0_9PSEU